ncbi:IclR family transcriptional regulator [Nocardioides soli]|jgi:DNA-binding IclR family transcriptional regulator|uniref:Glycerol operon regulatory protein n=1 Tax=Nocardioides soli TaxID=1036020 RepID=A0A7W4VX65_9ACTN|nr:IclR family transcriptional regulator [Nocardioides soli]MBB3043417.1 DNA-binding IclR family transcriptional regulator [Nocardioides soli]
MRHADPEGIASSVLGRTFALLSCFEGHDGAIRLSDLSRRTGMPKATAHRLLQKLIQFGAVEREGNGYRIGIRLYELGQLSQQAQTLRAKALPMLTRLHSATQATVHLAVLEQTEVVYLDKLVGPMGPRIPSRLGGRMPAYCTGLGKAMLAHSTPETIQAVIDGGMQRRAPRTIVLPSSLVREVQSVRKTGIAYEWEESAVGVVCAAAPVLDAAGKPIAAISVSGLGNQIDPHRIGPTVRTAALSLAGSLAIDAPVAHRDS